MKTESCVEAVKKVIQTSALKLEGFCYKELGIFLRKTLTQRELTDNNISHLIPTQKKKMKSTESVKVTNPDEYDQWTFPTANPSESDIKTLLAEATAVSVRSVMNNHVFEFDGEVYVQTDEGSTGLRLTGVLAEIIMILWSKELSEKMTKAGVKNDLIPRFVDDITLLPTVIKPGMRLVDEKLKHFEEHVEADNQVEDDERTMQIISQIANSISDEISVTYDIPSNYEDRKIPILDIKAGLNDDNNNIEFIFYKKPIANKYVTHKSSAQSIKQKMNTLTQQCFSRLHNTSEELDDSVKVEELDKYMQELKLSGYTESERLKILKGGINTYKNIKRLEINNIRPFYRSNSFQKTERMENKSKKKKHWFKGRNCDLRYKSVMFVEATPEDTLLKMLKTTEEQHKISDNHRIKFVSKSGSKLENILERKNPFESNCHSNDCKPCANSNLKTNQLSKCRTNNVSYESTCKLCEKEGRQRVYIGETARNLYTRSKEHYRDLKNNVQTSWMLKHINAEHAGIKEGV